MAVTDKTPLNVSVAAAGATVFAYDFKVNAQADLLVRVDGVSKVAGVDFTATGVGSDAGGNITLLAPLAGGETVLRKRQMSFARDTDFQNLGDLRSSTMNNDQDAPVMMVQQLAEEVGRGLHLPPESVGVDTELPAPVAGNVLVWNEDGSALVNGNPALSGDLLLRAALADAATADRGADLVGVRESSAALIDRSLGIIIRNSPLSLRAFATGAPTDNASAGMAAWLTALSGEGRRGSIPAGSYRVGGIQLLGMDDLHIEAHPEARIIGLPSLQNFAGNGATGQQFTVTDFTKSYGSIRVAQITSGGIHIPLDVGVHFSVSGYTITMLGANTIPIGDTLRAVSSESIMEVRSLGTSSARSGRFSWEGGYWDVSGRGVVNSQASGSGLTIHYFNKYDLDGCTFYGAEDYIAGDAAGVADSGFTALYCDNGSITGNTFQGFGDLGVYATGGELASDVDDGIGLVIQGNHFVKNAMGWKSARQLKNTVASGNTYDRCWIGAALWPASDIKAGRGSITGETFYRCGRNAIDVRQQVGCVIANNRIIDHGYLLDGTTTADLYGNGGSVVAIGVSGCRATNVSNNVIVMELLPKQASAYGIRNLSLTFEGLTDQPTDNLIHDNLIDGYNIAIQENGSGAGSRYRFNEFRNCTTEYSGIPTARLPYGEYAPIVANTANVSASAMVVARFRRSDGEYIQVDFAIDIDLVAAGTPAEVRFPLPVPLHAAAAADSIIGTAVSDVVNLPARIYSTGTEARMLMRPPTGADLGNRRWSGSFSYRAAPQ